MTTVRQRMLRAEDFPAELRQALDPLLRYCNDLNTDSASILNGGLSLSVNGASFVATVTLQLQDDWVAPSLLNGWVDYGGAWETAAYRKQGREVILRGLVKGGAVATTVLSMPAQLAPPSGVHLPTIADNQAATIQVNADGTVRLAAAISSSSHLSIRARWEASDPSPAPNAAFPVSVKNQLKGGATPFGVQLVRAVDVTVASAPTPVAASGCPSWKMSGGNVAITDVTGLTAGHRYQLTFLVMG